MAKPKKTLEPAELDMSVAEAGLIGERLRAYRKAIGMSQVDFAGRAGVTPQAYNNWEKGRQRPELDSGIALALAHKIPLDWIYLGRASELKTGISDKIDRRLMIG